MTDTPHSARKNGVCVARAWESSWGTGHLIDWKYIVMTGDSGSSVKWNMRAGPLNRMFSKICTSHRLTAADVATNCDIFSQNE